MERNAAGALVAVGMLRGANFLFVGLLVQQIAAPELVAGRLGFAALAATAFLVARGSFSPMSFGSIGAATVLASLDTVVPYTLLAFAQTSIDSGVAAILATTAPLFTMLVAITLGGDERLSPLRLAGLFLALFGVALLTGFGVLDVTQGDGPAIGAVILASVSYGGSIVYARHLLRSHDAITLTTLKLSSGAVQALVVALVVEGMPSYGALDVQGWLFLVILGVGGTGLAYLLHFWTVARVGSVRGSMVTYISPLASLLLGCLVLGEALTVEMLAGVVILATGVAAVMYAETIEWQFRKTWCATVGQDSTSCRLLFTAAG